MKKMRKIALPLAVLLLGAGSAYATSVVKKSSLVENGYRFDPLAPVEKCIMTEKSCQPDVITEVCTWSDGVNTHNLFQNAGGTSCGNPLYEIPN